MWPTGVPIPNVPVPPLLPNMGLPTMPSMGLPTLPIFEEETPEGAISKKNPDDPMPPVKTKFPPHFGVEKVLGDNIVNSDYYKGLFRRATVNDVIEEFLRNAKNLEPRIPGLSRQASTAFCILYKLFAMQLSEKQITELIEHENQMVRGLGFLYLRYTLQETKLWEWFEAYLDDPDEFKPGAIGAVETMGSFVRNLLAEQRYYQTTLPKVSMSVLQIYKRELLKHEFVKKLDNQNERFRRDMKEGTEVKALYDGDGNWYDAVIVSEKHDNFVVNFTEYDESAEVSIGKIRLKKKPRSRRDRSRSRDRGRDRESTRDRDRDRDRRDRDRSRRDRDRSRRSGRGSDRDRGRRRRRSVDYDYSDIPESFSKESLDAIIKERESKKYVSSNAYDVIRPQDKSGDGRGSVPFEVATLRQRTPSPPPQRAPKILIRKPNIVVRKKEKSMEARIAYERKLAQLRSKYGDASATGEQN